MSFTSKFLCEVMTKSCTDVLCTAKTTQQVLPLVLVVVQLRETRNKLPTISHPEFGDEFGGAGTTQKLSPCQLFYFFSSCPYCSTDKCCCCFVVVLCCHADKERSDERTKATSSYVDLVGLKVFSSVELSRTWIGNRTINEKQKRQP
jgi:hypothetical protein